MMEKFDLHVLRKMAIYELRELMTYCKQICAYPASMDSNYPVNFANAKINIMNINQALKERNK